MGAYAPESSLGWLDLDAAASERVGTLLRSLEEPTTLDVLGLGTVRDAFSDMRAVYAGRKSEWSRIIAAETTEPLPVLSPGTPTSSSVTVNWTAPDTDLDLLGYELSWRRADEADWTEVRDIASTQTTHTITGLDAGTAYEVRVRAMYAGREGEWSPVIAVETPTSGSGAPSPRPAPRTPSIFEIASVTPTSITVSLKATDTAITSYDLGWKGVFATTWDNNVTGTSGTRTTYTITGLERGHFLIRVRTVTGGVAGEWFYAGAVTRGGYAPHAGPRISVRADDAVADERDGAVYFFLDTPDSVTKAITVNVDVGETGSMVQSTGIYRVRIGVGGTRVKFRVGLVVDTVAEPDSLVSAMVSFGDAVLDYDIGDTHIALIRVKDDD